MLLGALVDAGVDPADLNASLRRLPLDGLELVARKVRKGAVAATKVDVLVAGHPAEGDGHHGAGEHRGLAEVLALLGSSSLPQETVGRAGEVFRVLAEAEGRIHGLPAERVHFHEVGALDAIADVVGVIEGLRLLGAERVLCGPLPLGGGRTTCAHGILPLPAPATLELVRGFPIREAPGEGELVTPTGAALMKVLAEPVEGWPRLIPEAVGYGAGTRDLPWPNVVRLVVGREWGSGAGSSVVAAGALEAEAARELGSGLEECFVLECNVDDMSPELFGHVQEKLFGAGALDVFLHPVQMKKQRPGVLVSVICPDGCLSSMLGVLLSETTTIGVRGHRVTRWMAEREVKEVVTRFGTVRVKCAYLGGKLVNVAPEYEDCKAAAASSGAPLKVVMAEALRAGMEGWHWAG
jgi:uncharacterized protein (TIGR00299 family) protein